MLKAMRVPDVMNPFGVFAGRVRQNGKWAGSRIRPAPSFYALVQFDTVADLGMVDRAVTEPPSASGAAGEQIALAVARWAGPPRACKLS
jgi:hypothetical protein